MTDTPAPRVPLKFAADIPFVEALGLQLWRFADGVAELSLEVRPDMRNSWAVTHGGVLMTLLDVAMAHAARSTRDDIAPGTPGFVTVEMKTSFLHPAATDRLVAVAAVLQGTRSLSFCEGRVLDADGRLCAHATGTFKLMRAASSASSKETS